jgi:hypothetical protein
MNGIEFRVSIRILTVDDNYHFEVRFTLAKGARDSAAQ